MKSIYCDIILVPVMLTTGSICYRANLSRGNWINHTIQSCGSERVRSFVPQDDKGNVALIIMDYLIDKK